MFSYWSDRDVYRLLDWVTLPCMDYAKRTGKIRQMDYSDGCAEGLIEAIEIVKEEGGIE